MNEITKKWKSTGLLENIEGIHMEGVAFALQEMGKLLIERSSAEETDYDSSFAGAILPLIVRLYIDIGEIFPTEWLYNDFKTYFNTKTNINEPIDMSSTSNNDWSLEICNSYIERIKNNII